MKKLKYLIKRIFNMNFGNFFKTINDVHDRTGKNRIFLFFDIIICGLRYEAGYMDYQLFEMYKMNNAERKTIITRGKNNNMIKKYNNPEYFKYFRNKALFNEKFDKYLNRDWLLLDGNNLEEFKKFLSNKKEFMAKPTNGTCGKGIEKLKVSKKDIDKLYNQLITNGQTLVEEVAVQCEVISKLHPYSINTIRAVTLKGKLVAAYLRIGSNKNVVDNFNHGGMVVPIDIEDGIIKFPALDKSHNLYEVHPITNEKIVGTVIPNFNKIKKLVSEASKVIPELGLVGWDVCDGVEKPFLIEGNEFPGHDIYQLPPHRNGNVGLYPVFEKAMEERK